MSRFKERLIFLKNNPQYGSQYQSESDEPPHILRSRVNLVFDPNDRSGKVVTVEDLFNSGVFDYIPPHVAEGYARPLVDRIDLENRFSFRLYRPSTTSTEYREHVKDLSGLARDMGRIVIVDNNPFSFLLQPLNGIPCIPFSAGQTHDTQLLDVLLPLLKHLSLQKDVRPVLYERFHMPEWFQKQGIPSTSWKK